MQRFKHIGFTVGLLGAWFACCGAVHAMASGVTFDIAAGSAPTTLKEFAAQAHMQLLFDYRAVQALKTPAVKGQIEPSEALKALLRGSGLTFRQINDHTIAVMNAGATTSSTLSSQDRAQFSAESIKGPEGISSTFGSFRMAQSVQGETSGPASATVMTQNASQEGGIQQVTVTARRRAESEQSVPLSVTAIPGKQLEEFNIESLGDLQHSVPSMSMFGPFRDTPIVSIRGQGGYTPGGIPSVIMYSNEVPTPTSAQAGSPGGALGGDGLFLDLASIQVLKGPQGTLFGRNTTGGAVLLESKRPDDDFGGHLQVTAGDYNDKEVDAVLNAPVIEHKLLVRVAVNMQDRDGFTETMSTPSAPGGTDLDNAKHFAGRMSVRWRPSDRVTNDTIVGYYNSETHGTSLILSGVSTDPTNPVNRLFPGIAAVFAQQQALGIRRQVPIDVDPYSDRRMWGATDILAWDLSNELTLRNIASYSDAKYSQTIDGDGTVYPIFDPIAAVAVPYTTRQYTEEAQLQGKSLGGKLTWTMGLFYLDSPEEDRFAQWTNRTFGATRYIGSKQYDRSKAVYGQGTYDLSSWLGGLSFTAGYRYSWDSIGRTSSDVRASGACTSPYSDANCTLYGRGSFNAPNWNLGFNYQVSQGTLLYVASRHGFRDGGFNLAGDAAPTDREFDPEYVTDFEVGVKSDWQVGGMDARTNVAAYLQNYTDIQLSQVTTSSITGGPLTVVKNAGEARISGLEFEGALKPVRDFEVNARFAWLNYDITKVNPGVVLPIVVTNIPKYKYGVTLNYTLPVARSIGNIGVSADWNWQSSAYIAATTDPLSLQSDYGLLSLAAHWDAIGGSPMDLSFFATNVTNEGYAIGGLPLRASLGIATLAYGAPRMFGVRGTYHFGTE
jgi:iron complex outermembrane recepter protein